MSGDKTAADRLSTGRANGAAEDEMPGAGTDHTKAWTAIAGPVVVLVEPQLGENIGTAARAMANFGLTRLRLVNPRDAWPNPHARRAASGADAVIEGGELFDTIEAARADCSFMLAATQPGLYRAVVYSGTTPSDELQNVQTPVLAHYAQLDFRVTGNAILTENTMKQLGKKYTYFIYPNTDHAFFNESSPRYDAEASKLAWTRTLEFLRSSS
jgi:hypothetical protein